MEIQPLRCSFIRYGLIDVTGINIAVGYTIIFILLNNLVVVVNIGNGFIFIQKCFTDSSV